MERQVPRALSWRVRSSASNRTRAVWRSSVMCRRRSVRECFCTSDEFVNCPTLRLMLRLGRLIEEEEYLQLWLPPLPAA